MRTILAILWMMAMTLPVSAQDSTATNRLGLSIEYGMGGVAVTDEYISKERYSGSLPYIGVWYGRLIDRQGFQLGFTFQQDPDLENHAVRAEYSRVNLNFDQFYRMKEFRVCSKPASWYFGPSAEYFEYEFISRVSANHNVFSELIMVSVGINSLLEWRFTEKFTASAFIRSNVIGVNSKTHDERQFPDKNSVLQTLLTANNLDGDLAVRYRIVNRFSLGLKGKAQYTRSSGWDRSNAFVNTLLLIVTVHF